MFPSLVSLAVEFFSVMRDPSDLISLGYTHVLASLLPIEVHKYGTAVSRST